MKIPFLSGDRAKSVRETPIATLFSGWADYVRHRLFLADTTARIRLYQSMGVMIRNGVGVEEVLTELYDSHVHGGRNRNSARAQLLLELRAQAKRGKPLWQVFQRWVTSQEASLINTGEASSRLEPALRKVVFALTKRRQLVSALVERLSKPVIYFLGAVAAYAYIGFMIVPELLKLMPADKWVGPTRKMIDAGLFISGNAIPLFLGMGLLFGAIAWTLPNLRGVARDYLDRFPPWSIYRNFHGAVFVLNLATMKSAGLGDEEALLVMRKTAVPYLRERIDDTVRGVRRGSNIGVALDNAEHEFPDRETIGFMRTLASRSGFEEALEDSVPDMLDATIAKISAAASVVNMVSMMMAGHAILLILSGTFGIRQAAQAIQ